MAFQHALVVSFVLALSRTASADPTYCSGDVTLTAPTGSFSTNSDGTYAPDAHCTWLLQPAGADTVTVAFTLMKLETDFDSLLIYDGATTEAPLIVAYTSFDLTDFDKQLFASTGPSMLLVFTSNSNTEFAGIQATYYSGPVWSCAGTETLTTATGTITSHADGDYHDRYANMKTCEWLIQPAGTPAPLKLTFSAFHTEDVSDWVYVYDGDSDAAPLIGQYSGELGTDGNYPVAIAFSGHMFVRFTTDLFIAYSGFAATYEPVGEATCLMYDNKDWLGYDIGHVENVPSKQHCCAYCSATANCNAFTWNRWTKTCWIKNVVDQYDMRPHPYGIAGVPCPAGSCYKGRAFPGLSDFLGADMHSVANVDDFAACNKLCMDYVGDARCNAVTYNIDTKQCYLKNVDHTRWVLDPNPVGLAGVPCPNSICPDSCRTSKKKKYTGTPINTITLDNSSVDTKNVPGSCCQACFAEPLCEAWSYQQSTNTCQLFDGAGAASTEDDTTYHSGVPCRSGFDCGGVSGS